MRRIRALAVALVAMGGFVGTVACDEPSSGSSSAPSASASASGAPAHSAAASASAAPSGSAAGEGHPDAASADAMAAEDERLAYELLSHHMHHHTGFAGFVFMAAETIGASPDQEAAITKIRGELKAKMKPLHEANAVVGNLLADGVVAGKIDGAKVDAAAAKAAHVATELHPAVGTALEAIHKVLKPEQRRALADKVEANWALWKEANAGDQVTDNAKLDGHLSHVAKEFSLTPDQVTKIRANLDGEKDAKKPFDVVAADAQMKAFTTAFVGDTFDAKKAAPAADENGKVVSRGSGRMVRFYEAMAPVLTPDQRTKVAEELREHAREPLAEGTQ
jgi:Spy/CpxP family protein refolding chaperone